MSKDQDEKLLTDIVIKFAEGETKYKILWTDMTELSISGNYLLKKIWGSDKIFNGTTGYEVLAIRLSDKAALVNYGKNQIAEMLGFCGYAVWDRTTIPTVSSRHKPFMPKDPVIGDIIKSATEQLDKESDQLQQWVRMPPSVPNTRRIHEIQAEIKKYRTIIAGLDRYRFGISTPPNEDIFSELPDSVKALESILKQPAPDFMNVKWTEDKAGQDKFVEAATYEARLRTAIRISKEAKEAMQKTDSIISILQQIKESEDNGSA